MVTRLRDHFYNAGEITTIYCIYGQTTIRSYEVVFGDLGWVQLGYFLGRGDRQTIYFCVTTVGEFTVVVVNRGGVARALFWVGGVTYGTGSYRGFQDSNSGRVVLSKGSICLSTRTTGCVTGYAIVRVRTTLGLGNTEVSVGLVSLLGTIVGRYTRGVVYTYCNIRVANRVGISFLRERGLAMTTTYNSTFGTRCKTR